MTEVFWISRCIIPIDYFENGKKNYSEYFANLLERFKGDMKKNRPLVVKKKVKVHFHQGNRRVQTDVVALAKFNELCMLRIV